MQTQTIDSRIAAAYADAQGRHDRRTSDQLQRLVLYTGERLIRIAPQHNVFEDALDVASAVWGLSSNGTENLHKRASVG